MKSPLALALFLFGALAAAAAETHTVALRDIADEKAVFATVESANVVPARARIGGTIAKLAVVDGAQVKAGDVLATVGDEKLVLQVRALDAAIRGLEAQLAQAQTDLARAQELFDRGTVSRARLDAARTAVKVAENALSAETAQRSVVERQLGEGQVLAPASGRVLTVPVTEGTVVMAGETIATVAEENYVLRLSVPERHARFMKAGDPVRLAGGDIGTSASAAGTIVLVYPQIEDGRVVADARVDGLGDYFVGERVRVIVASGSRRAIVVPAGFLTTRAGIDFVRLQTGTEPLDVPVQRGRAVVQADMQDGIEILSGLQAGDVLVAP